MEAVTDLPFWRCDTSGNSDGCHHKSTDRTRPLGNIPTPELREIRKAIHKRLDALWIFERKPKIARRAVYDHLSKAIGREYHTGEIRSRQEADKVVNAVNNYGAESP